MDRDWHSIALPILIICVIVSASHAKSQTPINLNGGSEAFFTGKNYSEATVIFALKPGGPERG